MFDRMILQFTVMMFKSHIFKELHEHQIRSLEKLQEDGMKMFGN